MYIYYSIIIFIHILYNARKLHELLAGINCIQSEYVNSLSFYIHCINFFLSMCSIYLHWRKDIHYYYTLLYKFIYINLV